MQMDGRSDMTKLIVTFNNFTNVAKNGTCDILVFTYFLLEVQNYVIYMVTVKEFFPNKSLEMYNENQSALKQENCVDFSNNICVCVLTVCVR